MNRNGVKLFLVILSGKLIRRTIFFRIHCNMNRKLLCFGASSARRFLSNSSKRSAGGGDSNRADTG
ncbi:hypothetical protein CRE_12573 [Caenorhabditis remanei]|uniref:Uncharacterized protein n=2 Tax=Caenorhabditis remanei TaxID=31234 RepID=E3M7R4_CAERE|nr:hypothetical protein CRE_12575 [Caenorhabditis remanei]EFO93927.1 hypothetical protein CRE_12573 [Caenorhabditis remanei]